MQQSKNQTWKYVFIVAATIGLIFVVLGQQEKRKARKQDRIERIIEESVQEKVDQIKETSKESAPKSELKTKGGPNAKLEERFRKYQKLAAKHLLTAKERQLKYEALSDRKLLRKAFIELTLSQSRKKWPQHLSDSMAAIDYLEQAAMWTKNPQRADVLTKINYFLMNDLLDQSQDEKRLRGLAMNKAELYLVLKQADRQAAVELKNVAEGTRLERLIYFAENNM